jgi:aldehyde dehydrogenase (NAD(P)+)
LGAILSGLAPRKAYYPGAFDRYRALTTASNHVLRFGPEREGTLPWTLIRGLDPEQDLPHFKHEPFCSILSVVTLGSGDALEFLQAATRFANEKLWGTLNATLFVPGTSERDRAISAALQKTLRTLRYGTVCVNVWPGVAYGFGTLPWGGHPSATLANVQSGMGWVHNTPMLERIDKAVLRTPLRILPKAPYFPDHRTLAKLGRKMADFYLDPAVRRLPAIAFDALRG